MPERDPDLLAKSWAASSQGSAPKYVIVIPTQKNAKWWNLPADTRLQEMKVHIEPTLKYLTSLKRKLYHSSGLGDVDFITYFETNNLTAFNDLVLALPSVPENKYNIRSGRPTVLGTIHSVDDVLKALSE